VARDLFDPPSNRPPLDADVIKTLFTNTQATVEGRLRALGAFPPNHIYHPLVETIRDVVLAEWDMLDDGEVYAKSLAMLERLDPDPIGSVIAYEFFKSALGVANEPWREAEVADKLYAYMEESPFWKDLGGSSYARSTFPERAPVRDFRGLMEHRE